MFSNIDKHSETLGYVWKLAHNRVPTENIENANLPKICIELNSLVRSESVLATRRLSLRTSSNLIAGAAKLYKKSLDKLFDDVKQTNEDMIYRRKRDRRASSSSETSDSTAESSDEVPEEMRQPARVSFADSLFSPMKRRRIEPIVEKTTRITMSKSPSDKLLGNVTNPNDVATNDHCSDAENCDTEYVGTTAKSSSNMNTENDVEEPSFEETPESQRSDEGVTKSPILISRHRQNKGRDRKNKGTNINSRSEHGFESYLPFGYLILL